MLRLTIRPVPGVPFEHLVTEDSLEIGRASACDLKIPGRFTSRRHARLFRSEEGNFLIEDLGSRNGTWVNDDLIAGPTPVGPGDVVRLSGLVISIDETATAAALLSGATLQSSASVVASC